MISTIIIALLLGIFIGVITGITPGIHVNLVCAGLMSIAPLLLQYGTPLDLAIFIVAVSITHVFIDMVPSTFLGAPNPDTALAVLPAHKLLMKGMGFEAIRLSVVGAFVSLIVGLALMPLAALLIPTVYAYMEPVMPWIVLAAVLFLILTETGQKKKFWASVVVALSGIVGIFTLSIELNDPLLPLLSGAFGIAMLITSIQEDSIIPPQFETEMLQVPTIEVIKYALLSVLSGSLTALVPGLGSSQGVALASVFSTNKEFSYILIVAGVSMINFLFSIITLLLIAKARNGSIATIQELMPNFNLNDGLILIIACIITSCIAVFLTFMAARLFARGITKIPYQKTCLGVLVFCISLVALISGWMGLVILTLSTCLGLITHATGIKKTHAMGCLLVPVILRGFGFIIG